ncbi:MAG: aminotransferase class I/II-fold pyridoxal phosphate-dependent enzyme [Clostridiales bacterium]|jgi:lysine decarboxylase|nr:aminotransferase class I/II-fold pyridoxal phosphate-dependent enzyme [Clostridiales bacterium]
MLDEYLKIYVDKGIYPFHMPGHKRNPDFLPQGILTRDLTEVPGADNLYSPTGPILETQKFIANFCQSDECVLLTNGSTAGVLAAIMGTVSDGDVLIMARNSHRSAYSALALSGAIPAYVLPEPIGYGLAGSVKPARVLEAILKNKKAKGIYVTSPGYEGIVSDIKAIADLAHEHGMILIVDEAHGAHFPFSDCFPDSAISCGADVVVNSIHKTLPALTQTAALHFKGDRCDREKIKEMLQRVQTSSPSYILMSNIDWVYRRLAEDAEIFRKLIKNIKSLRQELEPWLFAGADCFGYDTGKLLLLMPEGLDGREFETLLLKQGIQLEMSGSRMALGMTSPADTDLGFELLTKLSLSILKPYGKCAPPGAPQAPSLPEMVFSPRQAQASPSEKVSIDDAVGQVCLECVATYPPGVPILCPGERVSEEMAEKLREIGKTVLSVNVCWR